MTKIRVLLVEEKVAVAQQIDAMLAESKVQFSIDMAHDQKDAMQSLSTNRYNVALVDFGLSDGQSHALFESLHANFPWLAIVVLTGAGDGAISAEARAAAHSILSKTSLSEPNLLRAIQAAVQQHRQITEQSQQVGSTVKQLVVKVKGDLIRIDDAVTELDRCEVGERGREALSTIRSNTRRIAARMDDLS
jgi:DNA-binding NarL/FixJ family response regulator